MWVYHRSITTAEWLDQLSAAGLKVRIVAIDFALRANIVPLWPRAYAIERDGHVLQPAVRESL